MRRSRNLPLPAGRLDYIIFVSGIIRHLHQKSDQNYYGCVVDLLSGLLVSREAMENSSIGKILYYTSQVLALMALSSIITMGQNLIMQQRHFGAV